MLKIKLDKIFGLTLAIFGIRSIFLDISFFFHLLGIVVACMGIYMAFNGRGK